MVQKNAVEPDTLELLRKICAINSLSDFALAGGTNLALRISIELIKKACFSIHKEYQNGLKLFY